MGKGKMLKIIKCVSAGVMLVGIAGCSSMGMNNKFSCGVGEGLGCKSVSEVNNIVDNSHISDGAIEHGSTKKEKASYETLSYVNGYTYGNSPSRYPEKKIKIWFAPHIDEHDNFVEEMVVYSVVKDAYWKY